MFITEIWDQRLYNICISIKFILLLRYVTDISPVTPQQITKQY